MYNTNIASATTLNDIAYLEPGIHDNVQLIGVKKETSVNGNKFLEFEFTKDGDRLTHTEWETKRSPNDTDDTFNTKITNQMSRILQIMTCVVDRPEVLLFNVKNFDEFGTEIVRIFTTLNNKALLRVKVVLNNKNYTTLPSYAKYTFIERMTVEKSKIKELSIDKFVKALADVESNVKENPFAAKDTTKTNDLPF